MSAMRGLLACVLLFWASQAFSEERSRLAYSGTSPLPMPTPYCPSRSSAKPTATPKPTPAPATSPVPNAASVSTVSTPTLSARPPVPLKPVVPTYIEIGKSSRGRSITAAIFGNGKKRVILVAGVHGDEPMTAVIAKALMATIAREGIPAGLTLIVVSEANPDGLVALTRVNAKGVDINRNFPSPSWQSDFPDEQHFPGTAPASEPETRALVQLIEKRRPDYLITLHAALGCVNWDGPGQSLAESIAAINGYPLCPFLGYETPGSLGMFAGRDRQIPTVTIELRGDEGGKLVEENLPALRALLVQLAAEK